MPETVLILFAAFVLDLLIGDPVYSLHPVRLVGKGINLMEGILRKREWEGKGGGCILVLMGVFLVSSAFLVLYLFLHRIHPWLGAAFNFYLCYSFLALGDLFAHVTPVIRALGKDDLDLARKRVAMIVGREVEGLDRKGVARATVETMAENFVDGFLSPVFWFAAGAALSIVLKAPTPAVSVYFMLLFKLASTLDSMVGYKDKKYLHFGWAGARLDDIMNFLPARLSLGIFFLGAAVAGLNPVAGLKTALRDRKKHDSPNAAHPESFVAGSLGVRLGGPTIYPGGLKEKPWLGNGRSEITIHHIQKTRTLLKYSAWIAILSLSSVFLFVYYRMTF